MTPIKPLTKTQLKQKKQKEIRALRQLANMPELEDLLKEIMIKERTLRDVKISLHLTTAGIRRRYEWENGSAGSELISKDKLLNIVMEFDLSEAELLVWVSQLMES